MSWRSELALVKAMRKVVDGQGCRLEAAPGEHEEGARYVPRPQFVAFHARAQRFACIVSHRRAGKTVACIAELHAAALGCAKQRPRFAYVAPFLKQSKTVAWDYLREAALRARPRASMHNGELRVDYGNGGQVRLYGADNPDALRGIYLDGVVLDEYADMDPRLWSEVVRPALADRAGWAVFIGTPRGRNDFYRTFTRASADAESWFSLMLRASDTGLIAKTSSRSRGASSARSSMRKNSNAASMRRSSAPITGSFSPTRSARAASAASATRAAPVWTAWDLGIRHATAIWFAQTVRREVQRVASISAITCARSWCAPIPIAGTSCRTMPRQKSSAPARAGSKCSNRSA